MPCGSCGHLWLLFAQDTFFHIMNIVELEVVRSLSIHQLIISIHASPQKREDSFSELQQMDAPFCTFHSCCSF